MIQKSHVALSVPFDNTTNGFVSSDVQTAIEEAKQNAEGFPRAGLVLTNNGTVANGGWINYSELLSNPRIVFPVKIRLKEISWNNSSTNLGAFNFEFYRNGKVNPTNLIYTYTAPSADRTAGFGYHAFSSNLDFTEGQYLYIKNVRPSGTALADLGLVLWIARIP